MGFKTCNALSLVLLVVAPFLSSPAPLIPQLKSLCYAYQQDINIAYLMAASNRGVNGDLCGTHLGNRFRPAHIEAFKYVLDNVNARHDLLPNISLGYVVMDTCYHDLAALAQTLYLLPDPDDPNVATPGRVENCTGVRQRFDVTGIVGPVTSREGVMVGGLATLFKIPTIMTFASSDELSDNTRFEYVMRMVPPDRYQADAILDFLLEFGWTYVSLLYLEGSYGENGAKQIEKRNKKRGICIAYSHMIPSDSGDEEAEYVVNQLIKFKQARAVICFIDSAVQMRIFERIRRRGFRGYFIWVGSDSFSSQTGPEADGSFSVSFVSQEDEAFLKYFASLTAVDNHQNPWFGDYWEMIHDCQWDRTAGNRSCYRVENTPKTDVDVRGIGVTRIIDAALVFAYALHTLIETHCPEGFSDKKVLDDCVTGERLLPVLLNTSFQGYSGRVEFDGAGDLIGQYTIEQYVLDRDKRVPVARWDRETESITVDQELLQWYMYNNGTDNTSSVIPESLCSRPCKENEYYIQKELPCCWECRRCRSNDIIVSNRTACQLCPAFMWPDQTAFLCEKIKPEVLEWSSPLSITLVSFASLGIILCLATAAVFAKNSHVRLIKASSRQLMAIILSGIATAYLTVYLLIMEPSSASCYASRFGFNLAVSLIYAPLMVKTNRIYRIFASGKRGTRPPGFIGIRPQLLLVTMFLLVEVGILPFLSAVIVMVP